MPDLVSTFRKPFNAQVAAYRLRLRELRPTFGAADPAYNQHDRAFMVAGAVKADLLADLATAVDKAVIDGTGFDAFKRDFKSIVEKRGWHGWTGEGTKRGEEWRMRTIYRTNMRTSYMAGRHAQLVDGSYKYWIYIHSGAAHPRLNHLAWDGVALPPDHPFWAAHFPPNDWGCGCTVEGARSEAGIGRMGGDPNARLPDNWASIDPRTGLQPGIGKGWGYSPDKDRSELIAVMAQKAVDWNYNSARGFMREVPDAVKDDLAQSYRSLPSLADSLGRMFARVRAGQDSSTTSRQTLGLVAQNQAATIEQLTGTSVKGFDYAIKGNEVRHIIASHGNISGEALRGQIGVTGRDFALLPRLIEFGRLVGVAPTKSGRPGLKYELTENGRTIVGVFELHKRRRRLSLLSYFIKGKAG